MNDNELKGLPTDIDLLETAIQLLKAKPYDQRRLEHLANVMTRVQPQVLKRKAELDCWTVKPFTRMDMKKLQIVPTNGVFYQDQLIHTYDKDAQAFHMLDYFKENDIKSYGEFLDHLSELENKVCTQV